MVNGALDVDQPSPPRVWVTVILDMVVAEGEYTVAFQCQSYGISLLVVYPGEKTLPADWSSFAEKSDTERIEGGRGGCGGV